GGGRSSGSDRATRLVRSGSGRRTRNSTKNRMRRMKSGTERMQRTAVPRASLAIDNLRAIVIVLVLAFHSVLAYLNFLPPHPFAFDQPPFLWRDRKSTRLNSSHLGISYAVFCLKKKKRPPNWPSLSRFVPSRSTSPACS